MQAYYETEAEVSKNHQLTITLPDDIPPGPAKLTVIYETKGTAISEEEKRRVGMQAFLANLPLNDEGGLSREEIRDRVDQERQLWDD